MSTDEESPDWWSTQEPDKPEPAPSRPATHPADWPPGPFLTAEAISGSTATATLDAPPRLESAPADNEDDSEGNDDEGEPAPVDDGETVEKTDKAAKKPKVKKKQPKKSKKGSGKKGGKGAPQKPGDPCECCGDEGCSCNCLTRGDHAHDQGCCPCCPYNGGAPQTGTEPVSHEQAERDAEYAERARDRARKAGAALYRRRMLAAKYGTGAAIGWGLGLVTIGDDHGYAEQLLAGVHADPSGVMFTAAAAAGAYGAWKGLGRIQHGLQPALKSVGDIIGSIGRVFGGIPVVGSVVNLCTELFHAVFTNFVPFRILASGTAAVFAAPWGYVATGYASAHGIDPATYTPHVIGLTVTGGLWWLIDRRTARWETTRLGTAVSWVFTTPTASAGLATLLYMAP
ncbi:hypothetical protein [Streptomyces sp. NPDC001450]